VSTVTVNSVASLKAAIASAKSGQTIQLAAGTYSGVSISKVNLSGVTITSADPGHKAVLTGLTVANSSGLAFNNLEFSFADAANNAGTTAVGVQVTNSSSISFDHDSIHGTLNNDPTLDIKGLLLSSDTNVSVTNSEFQQLNVGIQERGNTGVTISGDNIHDIRADGIDNSGSSNVTITNNTFSNFWKVGQEVTGGDHGDAIQFWTQNGQAPNTNITITNNVMVQGQGRNFQGIFVQDMTSGGVLPFQHLTISGNFIVGGSDKSIEVLGAQGLTLTDNTIVRLAGQTQNPMIQLQNVDGATLANNTAPLFNLKNNDTHIVATNDNISSTVSDNGLSVLTAWLGQHSHPISVGLASPTQLVADGGHPGPSIAALTAMILSSTSGAPGATGATGATSSTTPITTATTTSSLGSSTTSMYGGSTSLGSSSLTGGYDTSHSSPAPTSSVSLLGSYASNPYAAMLSAFGYHG
jgi:hypothetical protein